MINLKNIKKVHFIGIGGIGVSAIARMMLLEGKEVSGSDQSLSAITDELAKAGAQIFQGHNAAQAPADADLVIYTIAITESNPELAKARELGITTLSYPEILGLISSDKYAIAVSGAHGKTTTTAMVAEIALAAGLDPTVIVGSLLKSRSDGRQTNFIAGAGRYLIAEACEYRRSFLNLWPDILIITNIEEDHLDYYRDLADIQNAFAELAGRVPADGFVVADINDRKVTSVLKNTKAKVVDYSEIDLTGIKLKMPGEHNLKNAQAAAAAAAALGRPAGQTAAALNQFAGTWRRFEYKGLTIGGALVYDDYAHHPTEIKATLQAARDITAGRKLIVAFQPHLYSRTKLLFDDFVAALGLADKVIVAPIYAAREKVDPIVDHRQLTTALTKAGVQAGAAESLAEIETTITSTGPNDFIITMGAGDIYKVADAITSSRNF